MLLTLAAGLLKVDAQTTVSEWTFTDNKWANIPSTIDGLTVYLSTEYKAGETATFGGTNYTGALYFAKEGIEDTDGKLTNYGVSFSVSGPSYIEIVAKCGNNSTTPLTVESIGSDNSHNALKGIDNINAKDVSLLTFYYQDASDATIQIYPEASSKQIYVYAIRVVPNGVKLSECGMSTFCSGVSSKAPEGLTVYKAKFDANTSSVSLTQIADGVIPANTGVVLAGNADTEYVLEKYDGATTGYADNDLTGTSRRVQSPEDGSATWYVLINNNGKGQFKNLQAGEFVPVGKAYLAVPGTNAAKYIDLSFDNETTGIADINAKADTDTDSTWYTLGGQRVNKPAKGLYVRSGKKIAVK